MTKQLTIVARLIGAIGLATAPLAARAASFSVLYQFGAYSGDAANPYSGLVMDGSGNLYGTTYGGGTAGVGTVYELSPPSEGSTAWTETVLYSFFTNHGDGVHPTARLTLGPGGVLYGVCSDSGGPDENQEGTAFALAPPATVGAPWTETVLHVFSGQNPDGGVPYGGLAIDANGVLYGTTFYGGSTQSKKGPGYGVAFSLTPPAGGSGPWTETILHDFGTGGDQAIAPENDLLLGSNGVLYGTTGGSRTKGAGTVYQLTPDGQSAWTESVILDFAGGSKGGDPAAGVSSDAAGNLFGTTFLGTGTVYELSPSGTAKTGWQQTVLARFSASKYGGGSQGGILVTPGDVLYGTLPYGAKHADGTVFQLVPPVGQGPWGQTTLYTFPSKPPGGGVYPVGTLVADQNGNLYGVTEEGGQNGVGEVYEVTP